MVTFRACAAVSVFATALVLSVQPAHAALPEYKLGDVATEDVITPVPLLVVNPDATEALRQKVAQQVNFIVRLTPQSAAEAERDLKESISTARMKFMRTLQRALQGRAPDAVDVSTPQFTAALQEVGRDSPKDLPLDLLAPNWVRGTADASLVESLLQPVREVMAQPIVNGKTDSPLPANEPVRLIPVKSATDAPTSQELENAGQTVSVGKVISLWRAKRLVETYFPAGQEKLGRFAASFIRTNAYPDPGLTEILRAKRLEGVTVNDTYEAAQVIVRKGQAIDRKALGVLAVLREKSLIGTLQAKLEQERTVSGQITKQTKWIAGGLAALGLALVVILLRLRSRPSDSLLPVLSNSNPPMPGADARGMSADPGGASWRDRAIVAEGKAERAHEAIRAGTVGWMRDKTFQTLFRERAELVSAQQKAEAEMRELEQRLEQLHTPLQERINAYEKRIEELEHNLAAKGEENQALIVARITAARQQLTVERERLVTG